MGVYLYLHRLPLEPAVDVLTERRHYGDIEDQRLRPFEEWHNPLREPLPEQAPRTIDFQRSYHKVRDAIVGGALTRKERFDEIDGEPEDPRFWAIYGARLVGHRAREYFPWRYSLSSDVEAICAVLCEMTEADVRENVERAIEEDRQYEGTSDRMHEGAQQFMSEVLPGGLLPALRQVLRGSAGGRTDRRTLDGMSRRQ